MTAAKINDGGPAFPLANAEALFFAQAVEDCANPNLDDAERSFHEAKRSALSGMTLRDYFAANALPAILVMVALDRHDSVSFEGESPEEKLARDAYRMADAMLKARTAS